jgi:signal recognition particle subunit SRP54
MARDVDLSGAEGDLKRVEAIIQSMTFKERRSPKLIKASRKRRIAAGSGTTVQDVNVLLKQFREMQLMMKKLGKGGGRGQGGLGSLLGSGLRQKSKLE